MRAAGAGIAFYRLWRSRVSDSLGEVLIGFPLSRRLTPPFDFEPRTPNSLAPLEHALHSVLVMALLVASCLRDDCW